MLYVLQLVISACGKALRVVSQCMSELRYLQDQNAFVHLWIVLMSELHSWLTACKTKGTQGKHSYIFQSFESVYERHGSPGFSKVRAFCSFELVGYHLPVTLSHRSTLSMNSATVTSSSIQDCPNSIPDKPLT